MLVPVNLTMAARDVMTSSLEMFKAEIGVYEIGIT